MAIESLFIGGLSKKSWSIGKCNEDVSRRKKKCKQGPEVTGDDVAE